MATFTNQATLTYGTNVVNSNVAIGEILDVLSISKTALRETYAAGETPAYVINLVNTSDTAYNNLTVTDNLGTYTPAGGTAVTPLTYRENSVRYYNNGALQPTPTVTAGPPLSFSNISVPANGNTTIVYETNLNEFSPLAAGSTINNTVTVTGAGADITTAEAITAEEAPVLTIAKSVSPVPVAENGTLTYTFVIENYGNTPADATTGAVVSDTFNPILSGLNVTYDNTTVPATDYTYDTATGQFTTNAGVITVPAATFTTNPDGSITTTPGRGTLVISGTV